jgi:hypothetical protein
MVMKTKDDWMSEADLLDYEINTDLGHPERSPEAPYEENKKITLVLRYAGREKGSPIDWDDMLLDD